MFKIYGESGKKDILVGLERVNGNIEFNILNEKGGTVLYLLRLTSNGKIELCRGICKGNEEGIQVDNCGYIVVEKE